MPVDKEDIAKPSKLKQWNHLESIVGKMSQREDISIGLLIGTNCTKALEPIDIIPSKNDGPYTFKTKFDWCIVGPVNGTSISVKVSDMLRRELDILVASAEFWKDSQVVLGYIS